MICYQCGEALVDRAYMDGFPGYLACPKCTGIERMERGNAVVFNFGDKVKDKLTGFEGILIAKTIFQHDPDKWCIWQPLNGGNPNEAMEFWVIEARLQKITDLGVVK